MESILAYGDSNTWGLIPGSGSPQRYPYDIRWTGLLHRKFDQVRVLEEACMNCMNKICYLMRVCQTGKVTRAVGLIPICSEQIRCYIC